MFTLQNICLVIVEKVSADAPLTQIYNNNNNKAGSEKEALKTRSKTARGVKKKAGTGVKRGLE